MKAINYLTIIFLFLNTFCFSQKFHIVDKGCIKDKFSIKLVDQNILIEPDKFFSISQLNLTVSPRVADLAGRDNILKLYKAKKVISYKITITNPSDNKLYYGRIAFFSVAKKNKNDAVASFYKITIPDTYFNQARDGMTSSVYEYYNYRGSHKFLTWIIWLSDIPID